MKTPFATLSAAAAFTLTGVGTALLGATLPAVLHEWHLSDSRGGLLLLAAWGGSTAGALFVRADAARSAGAGLGLSALALLLLAARTGLNPLWLYLAYGIGLGLTMTAISLLRSRGVPAARADVELNRLNLLWAAGACAAPLLALHSLHLLSVIRLFRLLAAVFALLAVPLLLSPVLRRDRLAGTPAADSDTLAKHSPRKPSVPLAWAPLRFGLFAAASVGLESAVGSWLTTYTARSTHAVAFAVSANAAFWTGLLLSRAAHSVPAGFLRKLHTPTSRWLHIAAVGVAIPILLLQPGEALLAAAAFFCGVGLGPLYPFVLSLSLPRFRSTSIFVLAGVGASVVPWLTGALSSSFGSLRLGLLALEAAFVALLAAALAIRSELA